MLALVIHREFVLLIDLVSTSPKLDHQRPLLQFLIQSGLERV
jgi:hypothetical protein